MKYLVALIILAGSTGWISAFTHQPKEVPLVLEITPDSLDHARQVCATYRERTGGIVGHESVYDVTGRWYALPCESILGAR